MLGAVIPLQAELYFVKVVGPEKTIAAHEEQFVKFVGSAKKR
jgi:hypothetical protein